ncbi:hypothetical protein [Stutzerimonas nosocomialis]|uniref:hypothetical protein n=1 Tax=Stutzerimonas nosocomialis TaxID=1056496 RepID=UPI0032E376AB
MKGISSVTLLATLLTLSACASRPALDERIVGSWNGLREQSGSCQFLAWRSDFQADGRFAITFFRDAERTRPIQTERGQWHGSNGRSVLKTDGVPTAEVYDYSVIDENTIHYVNTVKDPTAARKTTPSPSIASASPSRAGLRRASDPVRIARHETFMTFA